MTEERAIVKRGDSFDIGEVSNQPEIISTIIQNPEKLTELLDLNAEQLNNIKSIITGAGAGLSSKFLSNALGDEIAGAVGGFIGGYISKRLFGGKG